MTRWPTCSRSASPRLLGMPGWSCSMSDRRSDLATASVGYGLTAGSAIAQTAANRRAMKITGMKHKAFLPDARVHFYRWPGKARALRGPRALFGAGGAAGAVGATGAAVGTYRLLHPREEAAKRLDRTKDFVGTGIEGNVAAIRERAQNTKENPNPRSRVLPLAAGVGAGWGGNVAANRLLDAR